MNAQVVISSTDSEIFASARHRLGAHTPPQLFALGNVELLSLPKTALFCSARCPGDAVLRAHDQAARWCDEDRCVISGFHSPVEKECLRILLRGDAPVILCPARGLLQRLPAPWAIAVASGRMLILSFCNGEERRVTTALSTRRNELVAALADEVCMVHAAVGGHLETLTHRVRAWRIRLDSPQLQRTPHD